MNKKKLYTENEPKLKTKFQSEAPNSWEPRKDQLKIILDNPAALPSEIIESLTQWLGEVVKYSSNVKFDGDIRGSTLHDIIKECVNCGSFITVKDENNTSKKVS